MVQIVHKFVNLKMLDSILNISLKYPAILIGSLMPLIPLFFAVYRRKYLSKSTQALFFFLFFFIATDIPLWITSVYKINNLLYSYSRDALILILLGSIYLIGLKSKAIKFVLILTLSIMSLVFSLQLLSLVPKGEYIWINRLFLGGISLAYFFRLLQNPIIKDILNFPFFWFNSGVLFYCLSTLMITFFFKFTIISSNNHFDYLKFIIILEYLSIVMFLFFAYSFWTLKKNFFLKNR